MTAPPPTAQDDPRPGVLQVLTPAGEVAGTAWLAGSNLAVTCAHVVRQAGAGPGAPVGLRPYPHTSDGPVVTGVVEPNTWREPDAEDVAFLTVTTALPTGAGALHLQEGPAVEGRQVTLFGFPAQALERGHYGFGRVGGHVTGNLGHGLLQLTECHEVTNGFSGGPVVDAVTGHVVGMVDSVPGADPLGRGRTTAYVTPVQTLRELRPGIPAADPPCPFNGLAAFTEDRAAYFVGRDRAVADIVAALLQHRQLLTLLGPSGSGKSSLALAGVFAALANGAIPGSASWGWVSIRTTDDPYARIRAAGLGEPEHDGLPAGVQTWFAANPRHDRLVVVLDQFEELLVQPFHERAARFLAELGELADRAPTVTVLLVVRDDFYAPLTAAAPALTRAKVDVPAVLTRAELAAVVAGRDGVAALVEPGLVERIVGDAIATCPAAGGPTSGAATTVLPLLEFTLTTLWRDRHDGDRRGRLTVEGYEALGGVTGCLARWCDDTMAEVAALPGDAVAGAARMLTALVRSPDRLTGAPMVRRPRSPAMLREIGTSAPGTVGQRWRRRVRRAPSGGTPGRFMPALGRGGSGGAGPPVDAAGILDLLARRRIVVTGRDVTGEPVVELVHDSLITNWPQLRSWLTDDQRFLAWQDSVEPALADWLAQTRDAARRVRGRRARDLLLTGRRLTEALGWRARVGVRPDLAAFIDRSRRERRRRRRRGVTGSAIVIVLLLVTVSVVVQEVHQVSERRQKDLISAVSELVQGARDRRADQPAEAVRWGLTAYWAAIAAADEDRTTVARRELVSSLAGSNFRGELAGGGYVLAGAGGDDWLLTVATDGTVALHDEAAAGRRVELGPRAKNFTVATFVAARKLLALVSSTGMLHMWNLADRTRPQLVSSTRVTGTTTAMVPGPDGNRLFLGNDKGTVSAWDVDRAGRLTRRGHSPGDPAVQVRNRTALDVDLGISVSSPAPTVTEMAVADKGRKLVTVTVGNDANGRDGRRFGSAMSGAATTWSVSRSGQIRPVRTRLLPPLSAAVTGGNARSRRGVEAIATMRIDPDGRFVAVGGSSDGDASAMLVDVTGKGPAAKPTAVLARLGGHALEVQNLAFGDDGRFLAVAGADQTISLWDVNVPARPVRLSVLANSALDTTAAPSFSRDNTTVYVRQTDGTVARYRTEGLAPRVAESHPPPGSLLAWAASRLERRGLAGAVPVVAPEQITYRTTGKIGGEVVAVDSESRHLVVTGTTASGRRDGIGPAEDAVITVWNETKGGLVKLASRTEQPGTTALDLTADGTLLAVGTTAGRVGLLDLTTPQRPVEVAAVNPFLNTTFRTDRFGPPSRTVAQVALNHDKTALAVGTERLGVYLYDITDVRRPTLRARLTGPEGVVRALRFSPDGTVLLAGSSNGRIRLYRTAELPTKARASAGPTSPTPTGSRGAVSSASARPSSASPADPPPAPPAGVEPVVLPPPVANRAVLAAAYSGPARLLATADSAGAVTVWDSSDHTDPQPLSILQGPENGVLSLRFDASGYLLMASGDRKMTTWSLFEAADMVAAPFAYACNNLVDGGLRADEWRRRIPPQHPHRNLCTTARGEPRAVR